MDIFYVATLEVCKLCREVLTSYLLLTGQQPEELFLTAIDILAAKCDKLLESL